tara:strand:- start:8774 stop:8929 length:156 start_codon:yes stop_codon:yes gene_type:complete
MTEDTITISKEHYEELMGDAFKLECLECAGVDNWPGYYEAMRMYFAEKGED